MASARSMAYCMGGKIIGELKVISNWMSILLLICLMFISCHRKLSLIEKYIQPPKYSHHLDQSPISLPKTSINPPSFLLYHITPLKHLNYPLPIYTNPQPSYSCLIYGVNYQSQSYTYFNRIMSKAEKLLQELRPVEQFEDELKQIEKKMRERDDEVKNQCFQNHQIRVDSIRRKQGFYVSVVSKKETPFADIEKIKIYLETTLELEKNKNTQITLQKKQCLFQWRNTLEALEETIKEYRAFAEEKNKEIASLKETVKDLTYKLQTVENKYKVLGQEKLDSAKDSEVDAKLSGLGVIPFICEKMDVLFEQKLSELNFGQLQLAKFKDMRNNILGKFAYTISLLHRKEMEKDRLDEEADLEMKYHMARMEEFKKKAEQAIQKQKEADQIANIARIQLSRQIDFIYKQKKKYEHYPIKILEHKRQQKKLENDKKKLRKTIEQLERKAKKSLGKKVEAMVAAKATKDAQERLAIQAAAFREMQIKAGLVPTVIEGIPQLKIPVPAQPKVEKEPVSNQNSSQKKEEKEEGKVQEEIVEKPVSQKSSKKKKEERREQGGEQIIEETVSQKSSTKRKKEEKRMKQEENIIDETVSQKSSAKRKKQEKRVEGEEVVDGAVSQKSSTKKKKKERDEKRLEEEITEETASQKSSKIKKEKLKSEVGGHNQKSEGTGSQKGKKVKEKRERERERESVDDNVSEVSSKSSSRK